MMACFGVRPKDRFVCSGEDRVLRPAVRSFFAALAVAALSGAAAHAQIASPALPPPPPGAVNTGHLQAQLVTQTAGVAPGGVAYVAIRQSIAKGWHTYWRNPGDSGEATSAKWTLPKGWSVGDTVWPAPVRLPLGPLTADEKAAFRAAMEPIINWK